MGKTGIIATREWRECVRRRSFVISTLLTPLILLAVAWFVGTTANGIEQFNTNDEVVVTAIESEAQSDFASTFGASALAYILGFMMYIMVIRYGTQVMYGVAEEKGNRVLEVMISSVKPSELMMGKILGVAMVALTQIATWFVIFGSVWLAEGSLNEITNVIPPTEATYGGLLAMWWILFFVGGYLLYAAMFAAVGSACDDANSSNQFQAFVSMPIILGLIVLFIAAGDWNGSLAWWCSMIPLTSPIVMMARIPYGVPIWEIVVSLTILFASFFAMVHLAGRVYRTGILMYGKKATFAELWRWIKYKY